METEDFTKCSICNGFFRHIVVRDDENYIIKHIVSCNICLRLIERKRILESKILDIDYELFVRRDNNL